MNSSLALYYIKRLNLYFAKENVGDIAEDLGLEYEEADLDEALRKKHFKPWWMPTGNVAIGNFLNEFLKIFSF